jgi:hypothetical protein
MDRLYQSPSGTPNADIDVDDVLKNLKIKKTSDIFFSPEPDFFIATNIVDDKTHVSYDGSNFLLNSSSQKESVFIPSVKNKLRKLAHEYTFSRSMLSTDAPLSELNITDPVLGKLTPDFIDMENKIVVELTTVNSYDDQPLLNAYRFKLDRYEYALRQVPNVSFYIIVVSPLKILTNLTLTNDHTNSLCQRYRNSKKYEQEITKFLAYDPFQDIEEGKSAQHIEDILSSITYDKNNQPVRIFDEIEDPFTPEMFEQFQNSDSYGDPAIVKQILADSYKRSIKLRPSDRGNLEKYLSKFNDMNSQTTNKRVTNFPFLFVNREKTWNSDQIVFSDVDNNKRGNVPTEIYKLWQESVLAAVNHVPVSELDSMFEATKEWTKQDLDSSKTHKTKLTSSFKADSLSNLDWLNLAEKGIRGKKYKMDPIVAHNRLEKKKSFNPNSDITDIEDFIFNKTLLESEAGNEYDLLYSILQQTKASIGSVPKNRRMSSVHVFRNLHLKSKFIHFADFISCIAQELAISYKHNVPENCFLVKTLKNYKVSLIVKPTGSKGHIFCSICIPKTSAIRFDTGRLGPEIYESENFYITDFMSFTDVALEHYVKSGPYLSSLFTHLLTYCNINIFDRQYSEILNNDSNCQLIQRFWIYMKTLLLLYLNNKHGAEELITSHRYLVMSCLNEVDPDPYAYTNRLPDVLRSRLEVYLLHQSIRMMDRLSLHPIKKHVVHGRPGVGMEHSGIPSMFCDTLMSLDEKVNEFYFGYSVSKNKGRGHDASFGITKKLMSFEYDFREQFSKHQKNAEDRKTVLMTDKFKIHGYNFHFQSYLIYRAKKILEKRFGSGYQSDIKRDIIRQFTKTSFSDLSTLKASAHDMKDLGQIEIDPDRLTASVHDLIQDIKKVYPKLVGRRPKMIEVLSELCSVYEARNKGVVLTHVFELVPYCLRILEEIGHFMVDLFPKPQHGGIREIYVLEVCARVVQYFFETISRTLCSRFPSETISNPKNKHKLIAQHHDTGYATFAEFCSINKSGDASKWSQLHSGIKFAHLLMGMTDPIFHGLIFRLMRLWMSKKIMLPLELCLSFLKNQSVEHSDPIWIKLRDDFISGKGPFEEAFNPLMRVHSGMMQGIPHFTSSFQHTILQEAYKEMIISHAHHKHKLKLIVTVQQGSDDSDVMIGLAASNVAKYVKLLRTYHVWKDELGLYVSIKPSVEKTTNCALDVVEYNSEWYIRNKLIRPTFRWVSASLETALVENFMSRYQIYSNQLTECLEGGASTFECALIQLSQAWMHYKMLGLDIHILFNMFSQSLVNNPDPSIGFFPLELDVCAGLPGLDFQIYMMCKMTKYGSYLKTLCGSDDRIPNPVAENRATLMSSLSGFNIGFSNLNIWRSVVKKVKLGDLSDAIDAVEENPELIFKLNETWKDDRYKILLKLFSGGVKASLSNFQPCFRMMVASVYMLSRPCFIDNTVERYSREMKKMSLFACLKDLSLLTTPLYDEELRNIFPYKAQYDRLLESCHEFQENVYVIPTEMVRKSKISLNILDSTLADQYPIIDVVRKQWFSHDTIRTGTTHFRMIWDLFKQRYPFLKDSLEDTKESLGMNTIELKTYLEKVAIKGRRVTLTDTVARYRRSFLDVLSRIYWPGMQLRGVFKNSLIDRTESIKSLRANMFTILTLPLSKRLKEEACIKLLKQSHDLEDPVSELPHKFATLKILHDHIKGYSKIELLEHIKFLKQGTIGYFTKRQACSSQGVYKGRGEWKGMIGKIHCTLELDDSFLESVTISSLGDLDEVSSGLRQLCEDFKLQVKMNNKYTSEYVYTGKQLSSRTTPGCSLIIDPELEFYNSEVVLKSTWKIAISATTIRLIISIPAAIGEKKDLTVFSDTFTTNDYDPSASFSNQIPVASLSELCKKWHNMSEINASEFDIFFSPLRKLQQPLISKKRSRRFNIKSDQTRHLQDKQSKQKNIDHLDVEEAKKFLEIFLFERPDTSSSCSEIIESTNQDSLNTISDQELYDFIDEMTIPIASDITDWFEEEEESSEDLLKADNLLLTDENQQKFYESFCEEVGKSDEYYQEYLSLIQGHYRQMPSSHSFLNKMKQEMRIYTATHSMQECFSKLATSPKESVSLPEPFGTILKSIFQFESICYQTVINSTLIAGMAAASTLRQHRYIKFEEMSLQELEQELARVTLDIMNLKNSINATSDSTTYNILSNSLSDLMEENEYLQILIHQGSLHELPESIPQKFWNAVTFTNDMKGLHDLIIFLSQKSDNSQFYNMMTGTTDHREFIKSALLLTIYQNLENIKIRFPNTIISNVQAQLNVSRVNLIHMYAVSKLLDLGLSIELNDKTVKFGDDEYTQEITYNDSNIYLMMPDTTSDSE